MSSTGKVKVLVIEDDMAWSLFVESILAETEFHLIGSANTLAKAKAMLDGLEPDFIISDIFLMDSNVLNFLNEDKYRNIPMVFMTNHPEEEVFYKTMQFPKSTFLAKPFHKFSLIAAIELLLSKFPIKIKSEERSIEILDKNRQKLYLYLNEIIYILGEGNYSFINTKNRQKFAMKKSLTKLMEDLDDRFVRVNKAHIVNSNFIQRVDLRQKVVIMGDIKIPIGRKYKDQFEFRIES